MPKIPELVCPAGNLPALKTAVDNGADTVYMGLKDATNARNFPGLNFDMKSAQEGVAYAHARGRNVLMESILLPRRGKSSGGIGLSIRRCNWVRTR